MLIPPTKGTHLIKLGVFFRFQLMLDQNVVEIYHKSKQIVLTLVKLVWPQRSTGFQIQLNYLLT